ADIVGSLIPVDGLIAPLAIEIDLVPDFDGLDRADGRARPIARGERRDEVRIVLVVVRRAVFGQILARPVRLEIEAGNDPDAVGGTGLHDPVRLTPVEDAFAGALN